MNILILVVKNTAYILAILLFVSNYQICDYFYYNEDVKDLSKWWGLKSNIYAVVLTLVFYASLINTKGITRLILDIGFGLCIANVIDKVFFNVLEFNEKDIIVIGLTLIISYNDYLNNLKKDARTNK